MIEMAHNQEPIVAKNTVLIVCQLPDESYTHTNCVYVNPATYSNIGSNLVKIKGSTNVYTVRKSVDIAKGEIGMNRLQRIHCDVAFAESVNIEAFTPEKFIGSAELKIEFYKRSRAHIVEYEASEINMYFMEVFVDQYLKIGQEFVMNLHGDNLKLTVLKIQNIPQKNGDDEDDLKFVPGDEGCIIRESILSYQTDPESKITVTGGMSPQNMVFRPDFNFEELGIGGLDKEFGDIFRRAFVSRIFPTEIVKNLGISHVKGLLLYGPPGTGKTLIARQIGKLLNANEPKIVNGPDVLNKMVGQSEENIRNLFADAEAEFKLKGDKSSLHIIIFDEIDAICKKRGGRSTGGTGVGDGIVTQLLTKMDGVDTQNNVLVIGMTNRKDMIDDALLRSGRFEVQVEIGLPDEKGRVQIFNIHTATMRDSGFLDDSVDINELAEITKNYTGAEIAGCIRSASSFALNRQVDPDEPQKTIDPESVFVGMSDFVNAINECPPAFGVSEASLTEALGNGIINYSEEFDRVYEACELFIMQLKESDNTPLLSVLIEGEYGSGKTAMTAKLGLESKIPCVRLLSPEQFVGDSEGRKIEKIIKCFEDAYKSPLSMIIIDDIERFIDYVPIGQRFSNAVLQTFLVLLNKTPPPGHKLLIFGTTSLKRVIRDLGILNVFQINLHLPLVSGRAIEEVLNAINYPRDMMNIDFSDNNGIPVKKLIVAAEMSIVSGGDLSNFLQMYK
eukprot:TRINITY_DN9079_c0_g1_i1.p1 TRINITY_DN9079_c0_g1~~TRINITY_DN9079_c0_g1_i1.p1  ORF type:complete len:729 (-),score=164.84 TRINITY_DN9079_c0_g1_i1:12-2198(-)